VGWVARIGRWGGALGGRPADCGREGVGPIERKRGATMRVPSAGGTERIPSFASTTKLGEPDRDWARPPESALTALISVEAGRSIFDTKGQP